MKNKTIFNDAEGVALVAALIVTLVVFLLVASTMYVVTQSTIISGAGKRYATASEAADGAVGIVTSMIVRVREDLEPLTNLPSYVPSNFGDLVMAFDPSVTTTSFELDLPSTGSLSAFKCTVNVERPFTKANPGGTVRFPPETSVPGGGVAAYFKIDVIVQGPDNALAETSAFYVSK